MRNKNFIIIVIGQIISLFGNAVQRFSMSLYLLEFTGSTGAFARILAISTIPYIIFAPIAGRLSDRINRKKIMVWLDFFCSILIGAYAFILLRNSDSQFIAGTVMFILSICYTLYGPAVTSSIPQIVEEDKLTSANGIINQVGSVVNFAGPILAGVLYGLLGIKVIVIINAVSFFVSAVMEMFLHIPDVRGAEVNDGNLQESDMMNTGINEDRSKDLSVMKTDISDSNYSQEMDMSDSEANEHNSQELPDKEKEKNNSQSRYADDFSGSSQLSKKKNNIESTGRKRFELICFIKNSFIDMKNTILYLKKENKVVLGIIVSYALCNIFLVPILSIVAPYFMNIMLKLPSQVYGVVEGICVLGMISGGLWISLKPDMFSMKKLHYTYMPMIAGVLLMSVLGFIKMNTYASAGIFAICGMTVMLSLSLSNVLTLTFMQKEVPENRLGSVSALSTAVATVSIAPGQLLFGQLIDIGIPIGMLLALTAAANLCLIMFVRWNVRALSISS